MMDSPDDGEGGDEEHPRHGVLVDSLWMKRYEVMQQQYREIMGSSPSSFKGDDRPVECVSWNDAMEFPVNFS